MNLRIGNQRRWQRYNRRRVIGRHGGVEFAVAGPVVELMIELSQLAMQAYNHWCEVRKANADNANANANVNANTNVPLNPPNPPTANTNVRAQPHHQETQVPRVNHQAFSNVQTSRSTVSEL